MQPLAALSVIRTAKTFGTFQQLDLFCLKCDQSHTSVGEQHYIAVPGLVRYCDRVPALSTVNTSPSILGAERRLHLCLFWHPLHRKLSLYQTTGICRQKSEISLCGLLCSGRRRRRHKSLQMRERACLKLNHTELSETDFIA